MMEKKLHIMRCEICGVEYDESQSERCPHPPQVVDGEPKPGRDAAEKALSELSRTAMSLFFPDTMPEVNDVGWWVRFFHAQRGELRISPMSDGRVYVTLFRGGSHWEATAETVLPALHLTFCKWVFTLPMDLA